MPFSFNTHRKILFILQFHQKVSFCSVDRCRVKVIFHCPSAWIRRLKILVHTKQGWQRVFWKVQLSLLRHLLKSCKLTEAYLMHDLLLVHFPIVKGNFHKLIKKIKYLTTLGVVPGYVSAANPKTTAGNLANIAEDHLTPRGKQAPCWGHFKSQNYGWILLLQLISSFFVRRNSVRTHAYPLTIPESSKYCSPPVV